MPSTTNTPPQRRALARIVSALQAWSRPRTPTPQEYWRNGNPSAGWWKAL